MSALDIEPGSTGYFLPLRNSLDPRLFNGQRIKPEIRKGILDTLYEWWGKRYNNPRYWSEVWLAGSGVSYQWREGDDGDIDLDCLIGVTPSKFFEANEKYMGQSLSEVAQEINQDFYDGLDHDTAHFMGQFELTFYVNPGAADIRAINPYAAYDLTTDAWTVKPPTSMFQAPESWTSTVNSESKRSIELVNRYRLADQAVTLSPANSPGHTNAVVNRRNVVAEAKRLFEDIHNGRRAAFSSYGEGYRDWNEYRYKTHKTTGVFGALHYIAHDAV